MGKSSQFHGLGGKAFSGAGPGGGFQNKKGGVPMSVKLAMQSPGAGIAKKKKTKNKTPFALGQPNGIGGMRGEGKHTPKHGDKVVKKQKKPAAKEGEREEDGQKRAPFIKVLS